MISRRDWQLQKLGIIQWELKYPMILQGEITISIPMYVHLLIISEDRLMLNSPIVGDVLRTLHVSKDQVFQLTPNMVTMLPKDLVCNSWQLGVNGAIMLNGIHIISPALNELAINPAAKRELWQQICKYEHSFLDH